MRREENAEVLDPASALASVGGDTQFLFEIAGLVQAAWPTLLGDIRKDLAAGDLAGVEASARLAKTAAEYVSARRTHESALQLQTLAHRGDLPGAQRATVHLEKEVAKLQWVLSNLKMSGAFQPQSA